MLFCGDFYGLRLQVHTVMHNIVCWNYQLRFIIIIYFSKRLQIIIFLEYIFISFITA
jgi:hypothetical protein